jgi:nitroimidazol reductase NimA-like FMN-containing flavoprotein (pyridoxamine 5'-phosphate oxidase superfamily)
MISEPFIRALDRAECEALLASQQVGRLAFSFRDRVDIEPLHYVYEDGWIYGRTQVGTKTQILAHHPWVAFEVDEVLETFRWRSVVVRGRIEFPDPEGTVPEFERHERAVAAFRRLVPTAFTQGDPTPRRDLVFALHAGDMTGRAATPPVGA